LEIVIVVMLLHFRSMGQITHTQKIGHSQPAALFFRGTKDLAQRMPKPQSTIANGKIRSMGQFWQRGIVQILSNSAVSYRVVLYGNTPLQTLSIYCCAARAVAVLRDLEELMGGTLPESVVIETEAFGEALPMGCDDTGWSRQTNRRVELWVAQ
jgi:hypothetical protein